MHEEVWQKAMHNHHNAKFNVMYAAVMSDEHAADRQTAIESVVTHLQGFGASAEALDAPRRTYQRPRAEVMANLPEHIQVRCPSEQERLACETPVTVFGIALESETITHECDGSPGECVMGDGLCADPLASEGLPVSLRAYADFAWQRNPFRLGDNHAQDGVVQSPGRDLTEAYWLARYYGFINEGRGQVLAWRDVGACR
jgi:hypothetical protein